MESLRRFLAIVLADARQRWRAPRLNAWLLVLVIATWFCFPAADAGYRVLGIGPYRAAYSSAWAGMVVAMLMSWLTLLGFYLVRGALARDIESRCWELLVATPLSRTSYLLAKWLGSLLVLVAIAAGMLVVAAAALVVRAEVPGLDVVELLRPWLLLGLPALGICALCAVLFDLVPLLRRTLGNTLYVVLWVAMVASAALVGNGTHGQPLPRIGDVHGIAVFKRDLAGVAAGQGIDGSAQRVCMLCGSAASATTTIAWKHWSPAPTDVWGRLFWMLLPLPVLALAARGLDRAAAAPAVRARRATGVRPLRWLRFLLAPMQRQAATALVALELQHALRGRSLLAWAALLLAWGVQAWATPSVASLAVIAAWALFLPVFSRAASREREFATAAVIFSSVAATSRLLRVRGALLLLVGVACAAPALARFALSEPMLGLALLVLVASLSAWALALGALTGNPRPFELLFALGGLLALNGAGALDASVAPASTLAAHATALPLALLLLAFAWPRATRAPASA